jgi:hypothetical protein
MALLKGILNACIHTKVEYTAVLHFDLVQAHSETRKYHIWYDQRKG